MAHPRYVLCDGNEYRLSDLARKHHIKPQTLAARLDSGMQPELAVVAPILTKSQAGKRAYRASCWRNM